MTTTSTMPTTTRPPTTTTTTTPKQRRFDLLKQVIETGMTRSRKALNTTKLVEASYGDDADVFGGTEILVGTMDDMLDKIHEQVLRQDLPAYLQEHKIENLLDRVESIVEALDQEEALQMQAERHDQESAIRAMDTTLLPAGVTLENVLDYHKYQQALAQKEQITKALQELQDEIAALEKEHDEQTGQVDAQHEILQHNAQELHRAADVCSMVIT